MLVCVCVCVCKWGGCGGCDGSLFFGLVPDVLSSLAINLLREREREKGRERREKKRDFIML